MVQLNNSTDSPEPWKSENQGRGYSLVVMGSGTRASTVKDRPLFIPTRCRSVSWRKAIVVGARARSVSNGLRSDSNGSKPLTAVMDSMWEGRYLWTEKGAFGP
jgi:hypothetical protein